MHGVRERVELSTLVLLALLTGALWIFAEVTDEVLEGETRAFDRTALRALRAPGDLADPRGPRWLEDMTRDVTALGGVAVLGLVGLGAVAFLALQGQRRSALLLAVVIGSGLLVSSGLKDVFDRPRPDVVAPLVHVTSSAFPSGHSMMSALTYLSLGALLARPQRRRRVKVFLLAVAAGVPFLVGLTRVYLGVHYPTDVLAGWTAGAAWAAGGLLVARALARRGWIEPDLAEAPDAR